jgi:hypothetical protein
MTQLINCSCARCVLSECVFVSTYVPYGSITDSKEQSRRASKSLLPTQRARVPYSQTHTRGQHRESQPGRLQVSGATSSLFCGDTHLLSCPHCCRLLLERFQGYRSEGYHQLSRGILYREVPISGCPKQALTIYIEDKHIHADSIEIHRLSNHSIDSFPRSVESLPVSYVSQDSGFKKQIQSRE